jgi:tRNA threonylcarbamoyladenosine modification (KEOPS) complex  Pcc1 subunit
VGKRITKRERKAHAEQGKADAYVAAYAAKHGLSTDDARAELQELARVHNEVTTELEGTGVIVSNVEFNREENQVVVQVRPQEVSTMEQEQAMFDQHALRAARPKISRIELEATFGSPKTSLPFLGLCASATLVS